MNIKRILSLFLVLCTLAAVSCGNGGDSEVYLSENFSFTEDMATYMASYTRLMLRDEMLAAGVDMEAPLSEQEKSDGETWEDYLFTKTSESMRDILLYCEAALHDRYTLGEGMAYKANETLSYISGMASDNGYTAEEYVKLIYGSGVTVDSLSICTQMMALCEGYDLELTESIEITDEDAAIYADENPDIFLKFDALRYTSDDKVLADSLTGTKDSGEFLSIMSKVSGIDLTDSDKNGIPDSLEVKNVSVASDVAGEFAKEEGRVRGDSCMTEKDGKYTVTMLLSLPERSTEPLWNFRMIYISTEASTDPAEDAASLLDQWKEKGSGEEGFANLAARYSDDPAAYYGGLYSGTSAESIENESIAQWICDGTRTYGDTTVIPDEDGGAYMLYYISGNIQSWMHEAIVTARSDKADEKIASLEADIKSKFKLDEDRLREIVEKVLEEYEKSENE